jgi:hypothetical protein
VMRWRQKRSITHGSVLSGCRSIAAGSSSQRRCRDASRMSVLFAVVRSSRTCKSVPAGSVNADRETFPHVRRKATEGCAPGDDDRAGWRIVRMCCVDAMGAAWMPRVPNPGAIADGA